MQVSDVAPYIPPLRSYRLALCFSVASGQEAFDVLVLGPAKNFVRSFKNNFAVTKHEKACIGNADEIIFRMEADLPAAAGGIFRSQCEGITHPVRHENSGNTLDITKRDDEFIDLF